MEVNFPLYIAKRYLVSKKSHNIINIISAISVLGIAICTMALIVVLSVFNGFENLVISLYDSFDPDLRISLKEGKIFDSKAFPGNELGKIKGVNAHVFVIEENALLRYRDKQYIASIKGVGPEFTKISDLSSKIVEGEFVLQKGDTNYAVVGNGVAYFLSLNLKDYFSPLSIYVPKRGVEAVIDPSQAFNNRNIYSAGIFSIQQDFDSKYVIVPLRFVRNLLDYKTEVTSVEVDIDDVANKGRVQKEISQLVGEKYEVKNRYQLHEFLYKVMKSEKLAVYLILTFILMISFFNIIGSLSMLIVDKKKDISILWSIGANEGLLCKIFLIEGLLISIIGASIGLVSGAIICLLQQNFKLVKLSGGSSFVIDAYPVQLELLDFVYVFITILVIAFVAVYYPSKQLVRKYLYTNRIYLK